MFDFLTEAVENMLGVADSPLSGEGITKRQAAKLEWDGCSMIAAIAWGFFIFGIIITR